MHQYKFSDDFWDFFSTPNHGMNPKVAGSTPFERNRATALNFKCSLNICFVAMQISNMRSDINIEYTGWPAVVT